MKTWIYGTFFAACLLLASAEANAQVIYKCYGSSPRFPKAHLELFEDENGKLASDYSLGDLPIYFPTLTNAGRVTAPPARLLALLNGLNAYRDTGIDPSRVKLFQNFFIDGNSRFEVNLWKLMGADGQVLGWVGYAYGDVIGCY